MAGQSRCRTSSSEHQRGDQTWMRSNSCFIIWQRAEVLTNRSRAKDGGEYHVLAITRRRLQPILMRHRIMRPSNPGVSSRDALALSDCARAVLPLHLVYCILAVSLPCFMDHGISFDWPNHQQTHRRSWCEGCSSSTPYDHLPYGVRHT